MGRTRRGADEPWELLDVDEPERAGGQLDADGLVDGLGDGLVDGADGDPTADPAQGDRARRRRAGLLLGGAVVGLVVAVALTRPEGSTDPAATGTSTTRAVTPTTAGAAPAGSPASSPAASSPAAGTGTGGTAARGRTAFTVLVDPDGADVVAVGGAFRFRLTPPPDLGPIRSAQAVANGIVTVDDAGRARWWSRSSGTRGVDLGAASAVHVTTDPAAAWLSGIDGGNLVVRRVDFVEEGRAVLAARTVSLPSSFTVVGSVGDALVLAPAGAAGAAGDGRIALLDPDDGEATFPPVRGTVLGAGNGWVAAGPGDGSLALWRQGDEAPRRIETPGPPTAVAFSLGGDGARWAAVQGDGWAVLVDLPAGGEPSPLPELADAPVFAFVGDFLAFVDGDGVVRRHDPADGSTERID